MKINVIPLEKIYVRLEKDDKLILDDGHYKEYLFKMNNNAIEITFQDKLLGHLEDGILVDERNFED